jgi:hypothetical protein
VSWWIGELWQAAGIEIGSEPKGSENGNKMLKGRLSPPESVGDAHADTDVGELTGGSTAPAFVQRNTTTPPCVSRPVRVHMERW